MKTTRTQHFLAAALVGAMALATTARAADPLPSWNEGAAKRSIVTFVEKVTKPGSPDFVPVTERIATFDNSGPSFSCGSSPDKPLPSEMARREESVKRIGPRAGAPKLSGNRRFVVGFLHFTRKI